MLFTPMMNVFSRLSFWLWRQRTKHPVFFGWLHYAVIAAIVVVVVVVLLMLTGCGGRGPTEPPCTTVQPDSTVQHSASGDSARVGIQLCIVYRPRHIP